MTSRNDGAEHQPPIFERRPRSTPGGAHKLYARGGAPVELRTYDDRGHSAAFDHGWRALADDTLVWLDGHDLRP